MKNVKLLGFIFVGSVALIASSTHAAEYYVGDEVEQNHLKIEPNYLTGIEMSRMPEGMATGPDVIHLEVDVHAAKGEPHGFIPGEWIPDLTVHYTISKNGSSFKKSGHLFAMTAGDGPHYANNVALDGPGEYRLTYHFDPPSKKGFIRHTDTATGVPDWWKPFDMTWNFAYPSTPKKDN
jgi:uncharacterized protein involved in high-affinity Fe2+ transport